MGLQGRAREAFERLMQENPNAFELFQIVVEADARVHESLTLRIFGDMKEFDPSRVSYVIGLVKAIIPRHLRR